MSPQRLGVARAVVELLVLDRHRRPIERGVRAWQRSLPSTAKKLGSLRTGTNTWGCCPSARCSSVVPLRYAPMTKKSGTRRSVTSSPPSDGRGTSGQGRRIALPARDGRIGPLLGLVDQPLRSSSSVSRRSSAAARASASNGGTRRPVSSCTTNSGSPPAFVPITGVLDACASSAVRPNGSEADATTSTSSARMMSGTSLRRPTNTHPITEQLRRRSPAVRRRTREARSRCHRRRRVGCRRGRSGNWAIASTSTWAPLRKSRRPTMPTSVRSTPAGELVAEPLRRLPRDGSDRGRYLDG